MEAIRARTFVDAIGVNIHPSWRRTVWQGADWQTPLIELGVMNARGLIGSGPNGLDALAAVRKLFASGIKLCATVARNGPDFDLREIGANIDFLATRMGPEHLCGIESANEYNSPPRPGDWAVRLRHFQAWLYESVRARAEFNTVPVVGPSIWRAVTADVTALGDLEPYVDKACLHYYTAGRRPTLTGRPPATADGSSEGEYTLEDAIKRARIQAPSERVFATEFGYAIASGDLKPSRFFITETAAAKYLVRGLMDLYGAGIEKIFIYSLIDDAQRKPPRYHGLLDASLKPRKTFFAVRNFMRLLRDTDRMFVPDRLDVRMTQTASLKTMLFQRSDRSFLLAMYRDVDSYDRPRAVDTVVAPTNVTLSLPRPASRVELFTPTTDLTPSLTQADTNVIHVPVTDDVTMVRFAF